MCGLAGILTPAASLHPTELTRRTETMAATLRHRGPDDGGVWTNAAAGIGLGFRRLAVLDLSEAGRQPMTSQSGRFVIVYNGEIYNLDELRATLGAGQRLRGHSDTEILLACIERWGLERSLPMWNGMFALALWDRQERELYLARDRFGEKPLYYSQQGQDLIFASELKALRAYPGFNTQIDRDALAAFLQKNCVPAPRTIYANVCKLPPGTWLSFPAADVSAPSPYWRLTDLVTQSRAHPFTGSTEDAVQEAERLIGKAVKQRLAADVPVGIFLSGGIDSSVITALAQASGQAVRTFTVGFDEPGSDESAAAAAIANHLGTQHHALRVTFREALAVIPDLAAIYDEPFADSSQIPTLLLSRFVRQHVTVGLSGDGGDEVFGGYNRHVTAARASWLMSRPLRPFRILAARALSRPAVPTWDRWYERFGPLVPSSLQARQPGYKIHKAALALGCTSAEDAYAHLAAHWHNPADVLDGFVPEFPPLERPQIHGLTDAERFMLRDSTTYLPDDILVKVDRASMSASLETRAPFLDPEVVAFAWRLPLAEKISHGRGKVILRRVLARHVPTPLFERPKTGFGIPLGDWLRGPLRDWAESLLDEHRLRDEGYFKPGAVRAHWSDHLAGRTGKEFHLWDILMFSAWLDAARVPEPSPALNGVDL